MKDKQAFEKPFIGTMVYDGVTLLYNQNGNYSAILKFENLAKQLGADPSKYMDQHDLLGEIVKKTGPGHNLQKTDIISKQKYSQPSSTDDYLSKKYFAYFKDRLYNKVETFITITRETTKKGLLSFSEPEVKDLPPRSKKSAIQSKQTVEDHHFWTSKGWKSCLPGIWPSTSTMKYFPLKISVLILLDLISATSVYRSSRSSTWMN